QDMFALDTSPGQYAETSVAAVYDVVVYDDGTAEVANERVFQSFITSCGNAARAEGKLVQLAKGVLRDSPPNLLGTLANTLEASGFSRDAEDLRHLTEMG